MGWNPNCPSSWRVRRACASPPEHTLLPWNLQNQSLCNSLCWQVRQANLHSSIATDMKLKQKNMPEDSAHTELLSRNTFLFRKSAAAILCGCKMKGEEKEEKQK